MDYAEMSEQGREIIERCDAMLDKIKQQKAEEREAYNKKKAEERLEEMRPRIRSIIREEHGKAQGEKKPGIEAEIQKRIKKYRREKQ